MSNYKFLWVAYLPNRTTPNLEDQWNILRLTPTRWHVWLGWPCQGLKLPPA